MSTDPLSDALEPDFQTVFDVLKSKQCRIMLKNLDRPMTANEIALTCDVPRSTVYRKLAQMVDVGMLVKLEDHGQETKYSLGFDEVVVTGGPGELGLSVSSRNRSASEQLSELWSEVKAQTDDSA